MLLSKLGRCILFAWSSLVLGGTEVKARGYLGGYGNGSHDTSGDTDTSVFLLALNSLFLGGTEVKAQGYPGGYGNGSHDTSSDTNTSVDIEPSGKEKDEKDSGRRFLRNGNGYDNFLCRHCPDDDDDA